MLIQKNNNNLMLISSKGRKSGEGMTQVNIHKFRTERFDWISVKEFGRQELSILQVIVDRWIHTLPPTLWLSIASHYRGGVVHTADTLVPRKRRQYSFNIIEKN